MTYIFVPGSRCNDQRLRIWCRAEIKNTEPPMINSAESAMVARLIRRCHLLRDCKAGIAAPAGEFMAIDPSDGQPWLKLKIRPRGCNCSGPSIYYPLFAIG